ncbi:hypothetical protein SS1G_07526 [Sclerotinia sclerotiorum 1980 UF-70]|uniref:Sexual development protein n=2 Tax=Sclerotinia sclerotiorum (strain ATCC 18683 / 1980 / Ss-1) TaxID=665079 RepID=A7EQC5_SCLS1|nr:hypothetical protein SS1G_07526 [Sclerotinia sclerotiorum 1980 UF-70]APA10094.1 hypothetical protein sscle_06g048640 [Sclerotinia sclerotiorum 1980 UF-70]EDO05041.1 hypothetical protein SS1G_07526 [Sclerotinia sclerotiorum 1980 UF-70]
MHTSNLLIGISFLSTLITAVPFSVDNSFLSAVTATDTGPLLAIQTAAHGSLSNIAPPPALAGGSDSLTNFKLVAFNENMEVAFFEELVFNISNHVAGYTFDNQGSKDEALTNLNAIVAQEKLHSLNAEKAIVRFTNDTNAIIQPCTYNFAATNFQEAIATASLFTDVVMGTLGDIQTVFATNDDSGFIRGVAATLGQEGEQNGYFRQILHKIPSSLPFLTPSTRDFAFSALNQNFVVEGSCPNSNTIPLKVFQKLTATQPDSIDANSVITFTFQLNANQDYNTTWGEKCKGLSLVYINQQNKPVTQPFESISLKEDGKTVVITAKFQFDAGAANGTTGNGLTLAALAVGDDFANISDVSAKAVFGPAPIEVN